MINPPKSLKSQICIRHNQQIIAYKSDQPICQICLEQLAGIVSIDQFNQKLEQILLKENQENEQQHQLLQSLWDSLVQYQNTINKQIQKIIQVIQDQIKKIEQQRVQFKSKIEQSSNQQRLIGELENDLIKRQESNLSVQELIQNMINDFQQNWSKVNSIIELLKENKTQDVQVQNDNVLIPQKVKIQDLQKDEQNIDKKFEYQLVQGSGLKETSACFAFAFNKANNILIFGCWEKIKIYEVKNGKIQKELQTLSNHTDRVYCLYFMNESNTFVSGSMDKSIRIWNIDQNNQWFAKQVLKDHKNDINCLLKNKREDLLISGSNDETIRFWSAQNDNWSCIQTIKTNNRVYALSLNEEQIKLISCGSGSYIFIFEMQSDQQWVQVQQINVAESGCRLCFTIGDQFVFQPDKLDYLDIFNYDNLKKQFYKIQQIKIQSCQKCDICFPCQFIQQLNILTVKHGSFLNIFRITQDGNYELVQTIKYEHPYALYGRMTPDGQYLITWDFGSKEIQVRKLEFIE